MDQKRRQFLKTSLAGLGGAAFGVDASSSFAAAESKSKTPKNPFSTDPIARVRLTPEIETTRIGLGTGVSGGNRQSNMTRMERGKALDIFRYCYDSGIRFFDLADLYGSHEIAVEALRGKPRDSYTLSSKIWPHPGALPEEERPSAIDCVKRFLRELDVDYLDMVQIHCMSAPDWAEKFESYANDLETLKKEGLIRAHGVSCHALGAARSAATNPWVDAFHLRMNTTGARMEGSLEENVAVAELAQENGKGVVCMKILGEGTMRDPADRKRSTDFITRCSAVDVMIAGFEERSHVDEFLTNVSETLRTMAEERKTAAV